MQDPIWYYLVLPGIVFAVMLIAVVAQTWAVTKARALLKPKSSDLKPLTVGEVRAGIEENKKQRVIDNHRKLLTQESDK